MKSLRILAITVLVAIALTIAGAPRVNAQILLDDGNFGGGSNGNVLVDSDVNNAFHIDASLNGGPTGIVNVDSTELISGQGQGQATFTPDDGDLNNICFSLNNGQFFGRFSMNPQGNGTGSGPFKVVVDYIDSSSVQHQMTFDPAGTLGPGSNRFGLTAEAGFFMEEVCFFSTNGSDEAKQARILDLSDGPGSNPGGPRVPEPGTWAMLTGMVTFGGLIFRKRR